MSDLDTVVDQEAETVDIDPARSFVDALQSGNFNSAEDLFKDILGDKVQDALDAEKISVADTIFNGVSEEELDVDEETDDEETDEIE